MGTTAKAKQLYLDVAQQASIPISEREKCAVGRGGVNKVPRCYHLSKEDLLSLQKRIQDSGKFISPYGSGRLYTYIIESLVSLGVNESHPFSAVFAKFKELASCETSKNETGKTMWERFTGRSPRNAETAKDPLARIMQNIQVMQRLGGKDPYGFKLAQLGACIDVFVQAQADPSRRVMIQLRTNIPRNDPVKPINTDRKRSYKKTVDSIPAGIVIEG
jgi:hypothetical protein